MVKFIMHQRSYIEHCFRENDMELMKGGVTLPNVDEKGPPEAPIEPLRWSLDQLRWSSA